MTLFQRIRKILLGITMILAAILFMMVSDDDKYDVVIAVLALGLAVQGIKDIVFYFTMAKHMVGGKIILYQGVIVLDFALFTGSLANVPKVYILLYLVGIHAFSGVVETLRAMEARRTVEGPWKMKLVHGIVNFALALMCIIYIRHTNTAITIYCLGLIYSGVIHIISAFRRTAFILID
ncbi:MAG: hypothetical protein K6E49_06160 [Lachnospiraceae bacterium]|nr:hypothetical protein [Lachnospiraceae bacterium]